MSFHEIRAKRTKTVRAPGCVDLGDAFERDTTVSKWYQRGRLTTNASIAKRTSGNRRSTRRRVGAFHATEEKEIVCCVCCEWKKVLPRLKTLANFNAPRGPPLPPLRPPVWRFVIGTGAWFFKLAHYLPLGLKFCLRYSNYYHQNLDNTGWSLCERKPL